MSDRILTIADAAKVVPLSEKTLGRVARRGDGPFLKIENRWMVYEAELHEWVKGHKRRRSGDELDPAPRPRRRGGSLRERVAARHRAEGKLA